MAVVYDLEFIFQVVNAFASEPGINLYVCRSAEEAKLLLRGVGICADRRTYPLPRVILLDTLTPDRADQKLLHHIRHNPEYPNVPVVLLAGVTGQAGLQELLDEGANAVIVKCDSPAELLNVCRSVRELDDLKQAKLPRAVE